MPALPLGFWLAAMLVAVLCAVGWGYRRAGWGLPMAMVAATVGAWYCGDALYNDYAEYSQSIPDEALTLAWWHSRLPRMSLTLGSG